MDRVFDRNWRWHRWKSCFEVMFSPRSWGLGFDFSVTVDEDDTFHPTLYVWVSGMIGPFHIMLGTEKRLG